MENETQVVSILRIKDTAKTEIKDVVIKELPLTIILNNRELVTLLCSPTGLKHLAVGFLLSNRLIKEKNDIRKLEVDLQKGVATIETGKSVNFRFKPMIASGGGRGTVGLSEKKVGIECNTRISASQIFYLMENFNQRSNIFKDTGAVHNAALCNEQEILLSAEDIGRHNAIDKISGECLLRDISTEGRILITSGRVSSEIVLKVAIQKIPILISKSAPTNLGVKLADDLGMTFIGFARGRQMNIYTNSWRVSD